MSDLWVIRAEQIFSATGSPTCRAIWTASSADRARPPGTTGTPDEVSSSRPSASDQGPPAAAARAGTTAFPAAGTAAASPRPAVPRFSSQCSALPSAPIPTSSPGSTNRRCDASSSRPQPPTSTQVEPIGITGIGADLIVSATRATRRSIRLATASSGGRASGRVSPQYRTKSSPGSLTAAASAWSIACSASLPPATFARP
jgi:hypothetical protein